MEVKTCDVMRHKRYTGRDEKSAHFMEDFFKP